MTKFEKILFAIVTVICILIIAMMLTGNIEVIIIVNKQIESKVKDLDWKRIYQTAKYIMH